jgi:hypothetical protein
MPALRGVVVPPPRAACGTARGGPGLWCGPRRAAAAAALIAVAAGTLAGCAKFDQALGQQELVVAFRAGTSQATMLTARAACSHLPHATPEPIPTALNATTGTYDVRFRIDQASDADIARLEGCLTKFPSIEGVNVEQQGGD